MDSSAPVFLSASTVHMVLGRSSSGKTQLVTNILQNFDTIYGQRIERFVLVYSVWQDAYGTMCATLPRDVALFTYHCLQKEVFDLVKTPAPRCGLTVLVVDDQADVFLKRTYDHDLVKLATVYCHHNKTCAFFLLQLSSFKSPPALQILFANSKYFYLSFFKATLPSILCNNLQVREHAWNIFSFHYSVTISPPNP